MDQKLDTASESASHSAATAEFSTRKDKFPRRFDDGLSLNAESHATRPVSDSGHRKKRQTQPSLIPDRLLANIGSL